MPKKQMLGSILIIVVLCFVCKYIYDNYKVEPKTSLIIKEEAECKDSIKEYYTTDKITFYLDCIDDVVVDFTDRTLELNKAYEARQIDIDTIKKLLKKKYTLNDKKVNYYENESIGMIECVLDDKTNYIFGKDIEYSEGLCNSRPYLTKFTKEYLVLDVSKSKTKDLTYVTLEDEELDEVTTISLDDKYLLKEDTTYKFIFGKYNNKTENDIKSIFTNNVFLDTEEVKENKEEIIANE